MTDATPQPPAYPTLPADSRTLAIIVYGLYLAAVVTAGAAGIVGVVLAYIKRDEAAGTIWQSHFENAIQSFWIWFGFMVVGFITWIFLIGWLVMAVGFIYFLYRTIKGLLRALENQPYDVVTAAMPPPPAAV